MSRIVKPAHVDWNWRTTDDGVPDAIVSKGGQSITPLITGPEGGDAAVVNFGSITNPVSRDALGRINAYTQGDISYVVTYGSFGIATITGGGVTLTQNYTTAGIPSGVTLS
jgi:hypothetical protein